MAGRPAGLFACLAMAAALFVTIVLPAAARTGMDTAPASTVARSVDRIIVGYSPSTPAADKASIERAHGARLIKTVPDIGVRVLEVARGAGDGVAAALQRLPEVSYAERDRI